MASDGNLVANAGGWHPQRQSMSCAPTNTAIAHARTRGPTIEPHIHRNKRPSLRSARSANSRGVISIGIDIERVGKHGERAASDINGGNIMVEAGEQTRTHVPLHAGLPVARI